MKKIGFKAYTSILTVMMMLMASSVYAGRYDHQLDQKRKEVVHAYLDNLEHANPSAMDNLFEPDGQVVSTSQGHVNAHQFFFLTFCR